MDLARLRKKAILVPTPGQPEQEYLGKYLHEKKWAFTVAQEDFDLEQSLNAARDHEFRFPEMPLEIFPEKAVEDLLNQLNRERMI